MDSKKQERKSTSRLTHGLLAAAVAALVVMPVTFAGASGDPVATTSAASLKKQVKSLKRRVAALENKQTTTNTTNTTSGAPSGPAGGDLTGTFPNPKLGPNTVTAQNVVDGSLTGVEILDDSVLAGDLAGDSVGFLELQPGSVGNSELQLVHSVIGQSVSVANGSTNTATVACPGGEQLIGGGGAYASNATGESIIASAPGGNNGDPVTQWVVTGANTSGSAKELVPWATCLVG
jgi:hypothetical protein